MIHNIGLRLFLLILIIGFVTPFRHRFYKRNKVDINDAIQCNYQAELDLCVNAWTQEDCEANICCLPNTGAIDANIIAKMNLDDIDGMRATHDYQALYDAALLRPRDHCGSFNRQGTIGGHQIDKCTSIFFGTWNSPLGNYAELGIKLNLQAWEPYNLVRFQCSQAFAVNQFINAATTILFNLEGLRHANHPLPENPDTRILEKIHERYCACNPAAATPVSYTCNELILTVARHNANPGSFKFLVAIPHDRNNRERDQEDNPQQVLHPNGGTDLSVFKIDNAVNVVCP